MQVTLDKIRLGIFITGALALLLISLLVLGAGNWFTHQATFVTLFPESVQGLSVGSTVKYKGVPIGTVSSITIQMRNKLIRVEMSIEEDAFWYSPDDGDAQNNVDFKEFFKSELSKGLRARLELNGITGLKFVELNYYPQQAAVSTLPPPANLPKNALYIPYTPSMMTDLLQTVNLLLSNVSKVPFGELAGKIELSINKISEFVGNEQMTAALSDLQGASNSVQNVSGELENTLFKINRSLDALTMLVELLNREPNAWLRGRELPAVNLAK